MTTDFRKVGKPLDGRKNYATVNRRLESGIRYASPEDALAGWRENMCFAGPKTRKIVERSIKARLPVCVNIIQREQSPDGRTVDVVILTIDTRVTQR